MRDHGRGADRQLIDPTPEHRLKPMVVTYKNAPLVELVAELRWTDDTAVPIPNQPAIRISPLRPKLEELFMHFGAVVSVEGYTRFERVLPPGFPVIAGQVACRFRPTNPDQQSPLYQLGHGVFTANALPPYESWAKFSPHIRKGIDCLLAAHGRASLAPPKLNAALVRYIDAFRDNLTGGAHIGDFLRNVMRIDLSIPDVLLTKATDVGAIQPSIQLAIPTAIGRLEMSIAEGNYANDRAIVCDMSVLIQRDIGHDTDSAMQVLTEGRDLIHDVFQSLTRPIHAAMEPIS